MNCYSISRIVLSALSLSCMSLFAKCDIDEKGGCKFKPFTGSSSEDFFDYLNGNEKEKVYLASKDIYVTDNRIYAYIDNQMLQIETLSSDYKGIYTYFRKNDKPQK